jgi:glycosyltransferase involved in cell wall biosynthesis
MNVLFVSHCDFTGNSAMHIFSIAEALRRHGVESVVCVPNDPLTVHSHKVPQFQVLHHSDATCGKALFPDGRGPDLVHAWTPRELVRIVTEKLIDRYRCPYFVHLEDNERAILIDEIGAANYSRLLSFSTKIVDQLIPSIRSHPQRSQAFMAGAAGITVLMDRLLEFKPEHVPGLVFWAGFDKEFLEPPRESEEMRLELGFASDDIVLVYNGNIHHSNEWEVTSLVLAVRLLSRKGIKVKLVKTGWNYTAGAAVREAEQEGCLIDLGFVAREAIPSLVCMADILVQPGRPNAFNDYRFPSKLPEFLASGKPVILPRSNLGRYLEDRTNCLLLEKGDALEIAARIEELISNPALASRLGCAGRDFATNYLVWTKNVDKVFEFYSTILAAHPLASAPEHFLQTPSENELPVKLIAFFLPQFYPIKENDQWWGEGFTEWSNVAAAMPCFSTHHQPQLPANLGFYDLRVPEVLQKQTDLAAKHGIFGFCFYHYWFNGRKLLDLPLNQMLASGKPDFPFCLCWANENWTRTWDGAEREILIEQQYSEDSDERFIREVIPIFRDPRYIRVANAPLLLVYRVNALPDPVATAGRWRNICAEEGFANIHLAAVQSFGFQDPRPFGFDSAVEFPPHGPRYLVPHEIIPGLDPNFEGHLEDYAQVARHHVQMPSVDYIRYRGIMPAWDNSARRGNKAHILIRSSPNLYEEWLSSVVDQTLSDCEKPPLVFVNAWNEWAEGCHLEPDRKYGMAYLDSTRRGLCAGISNFLSRVGLSITDTAIEHVLDSRLKDRPANWIKGKTTLATSVRKTERWFDDKALERIYSRYGTRFQIEPVSYATVNDYCDSFDNLNPLATSNGDLKDVQRPWILKAILGRVPRGGKVLEIGAGEPFVADVLNRLGYEVWVVDPYDGSGNGPLDYERFSAECPGLTFIRAHFGDGLCQLPPQSLDCVYSISVLEHIPPEGLLRVTAGMRKFLKTSGVSIHAVDHVHRGNGSADHLRNLELMVGLFGLPTEELRLQLDLANHDPETYFLSAESHNRWRGPVPYSDFPMRICISVQLNSSVAAIRMEPKRR